MGLPVKRLKAKGVDGSYIAYPGVYARQAEINAARVQGYGDARPVFGGGR
jgi:hypothetical protein